MDAAVSGRSREDVFKLLFIVIEMCGAIGYSSIIFSQPDDIDHMKPMLYDAIRRCFPERDRKRGRPDRSSPAKDRFSAASFRRDPDLRAVTGRGRIAR
jgi:hypothetical protein